MTNGNGGTDELAVKAAVEHHVASYQRVVSERDELQKQNDKKDQLLTVAKIENEQLRAELAVERSRTASYQGERDGAVAGLAVYQTLYAGMMAQMRAFGIKHEPLIKDHALDD